jgi:hypothetical protein
MTEADIYPDVLQWGPNGLPNQWYISLTIRRDLKLPIFNCWQITGNTGMTRSSIIYLLFVYY